MSSSATRRGRSRARQSRAFFGAFAIVVAALVLAGGVAATITSVQGPRVTNVDVDPSAAINASGSRMILTTTQTLEPIDPSQVTVTPAAPFTVDTSGRSVGVRFTLPLADETTYTVTINDLHGRGGGPTSSTTQTFETPALELFLLQRDDANGDDSVYRTDLSGQGAVPVFTHAQIEDFRATGAHLVMLVTNDDGLSSLIVTDRDGKNQRDLPLPGEGYVSNLQSADRGETVGYTFSDSTLGAEGGRESELFTTSLRGDDDTPQQIVVPGNESSVADYRFVPGTDSLLVLTFDGRLVLTSVDASDAVALGSAISIEEISAGSAEAVVLRFEGMVAVDLTDGTEHPLVEADQNFGTLGRVIAMPGPDAGTLRRYGLVEDSVAISTTIALVSEDGSARPVFEAPGADAVLQTCVSPSGRYAAVLVAPDIASNRYDTSALPMPKQVESHIVQISDGAEVVTLAGFGVSWCRVAPR